MCRAPPRAVLPRTRDCAFPSWLLASLSALCFSPIHTTSPGAMDCVLSALFHSQGHHPPELLLCPQVANLKEQPDQEVQRQ